MPSPSQPAPPESSRGGAPFPWLPNRADLSALARLFELRTFSRWVGLGLVVGVVSGLGAAVLYLALDWLRSLALGLGAGFHPLEPKGEQSLFDYGKGRPVVLWALVLIPALGGLVSGLLMHWLAREEQTQGTDAMIDGFHNRRGRVTNRVALAQALAAAILVGSGGSAGREGPMALVGAGFGSKLGRMLKLSARERRLLLLAGAAAGIGAIFRTPLGAALFVVEVLYRDDFEVEGLVPTVLASVAAYSVFSLLLGTLLGESATIFATETYEFHPYQLPFYLLMAVGVALVAVSFVSVLKWMRARIFDPLPVPVWVKPAIGGLGVGLMALFVPQALGAGYGWLQVALLPQGSESGLPLGWMGALTLLGIALAKVVSTGLSVTSSRVGGVFGPSVVIGGMVGGAFGLAFHAIAPEVVPRPGAFVIVGMACFVGGVAHAPISTLVMASEMTGGYELLVPIMLAEVVTFVLMRRFQLFPNQVPARRESPAHAGEYVLDVLDQMQVDGVYDRNVEVHPVNPTESLQGILRLASESRHAVFPVVASDGCVHGIITLDVLREYLFDEEMGALAIAEDFAMPHAWVRPTDTLSTALERFAETRYPQLPVCEAGRPDHILGLLGYEAVLHAYSRAVVRSGLESEPVSDPRGAAAFRESTKLPVSRRD